MAPIYAVLAEVGLQTPLKLYIGRKFQLFDKNGTEVFAGVIESIGIDMKAGGGGSVCIIPRGGGWDIAAFLGRIEDREYRWTLRHCRSSASNPTIVRFVLAVNKTRLRSN